MNKHLVIAGVVLLLSGAFAGQARLPGERPFEPVVVRESLLSSFYGYPVNEIYAYAWDSDSWSWHMIPFQIDERLLTTDPFNDERERHSYFIPDDGLLDLDDELAFMVRDMGDRAPEKAWIENQESKAYNRLELRVFDPDDQSSDAFIYLFRSPTITEPVPHPYSFVYDASADRVENKYYSVRFDSLTGLVRDIAIKPPFGSGVDFFDRQKIRTRAWIGGGPLTNTLIPEGTEYWIKLVPGYREVTRKPVVRLIREVRHTFRLGIAELEESMEFYVTTRFYPFNGRVAGGASLSQEGLQAAMPKWEDPFLLFEVLRQSWDLNKNAVGMHFYNKRNPGGLLIDGQPDAADRQIDRPVREWNLVTGSQGSLFSTISLPDTSKQAISLYYYDDKNGGTGDADTLYWYDLYDTKDAANSYGSYGDYGFTIFDANSLELSFEMYFLPDTFKTAAQAARLADAVARPVLPDSRTTGVSGRPAAAAPVSFTLGKNYPNPFNQGTRLTFALPRPEVVRLEIFDARGALVRRLANGLLTAGEHRLVWDGRDEAGVALASGVYFYQLTGEVQTARQKLLLLR
jgi:hypothetical protein